MLNRISFKIKNCLKQIKKTIHFLKDRCEEFITTILTS